jgi:cytochrome c oxidase subunit 3
MAEAHAQSTAVGWGGGALPYAISSKKLGMWLFIVSDTLTFGALLFCYSYVRVSTGDAWPRPFSFSPGILTASVMTFCLLSSSLTMVLAVAAAERAERSATVKWILATMGFGLAFVLLHSREWYHLITTEHVGLMSNEWGIPLFGATFFSLTVLHMLHVTTGVLYLGVVAVNVGRGVSTHDDVEISGLYWHFVDLVWMFIFPMVYLLSVKVA